MKNINVLLLMFAIAVTGCASGKTMVIKSAETKATYSSASIEEGKSTVQVPAEAKEVFLKKLSELLFKDHLFSKGNELTIQYRFVQFDKGSQFKRWFAGGIGGWGEGSLSIEVLFFDKNGNELSKIVSEGKIGAGFAGGSINEAMKKAADEIGNYAITQFK